MQKLLLNPTQCFLCLANTNAADRITNKEYAGESIAAAKKSGTAPFTHLYIKGYKAIMNIIENRPAVLNVFRDNSRKGKNQICRRSHAHVNIIHYNLPGDKVYHRYCKYSWTFSLLSVLEL